MAVGGTPDGFRPQRVENKKYRCLKYARTSKFTLTVVVRLVAAGTFARERRGWRSTLPTEIPTRSMIQTVANHRKLHGFCCQNCVEPPVAAHGRDRGPRAV